MLDFFNSVSEALDPYRLLLATVGIPLLTLFVTIYVSWKNTKLSAALKVAEMRQEWINTLRNQMVEYSVLCLRRQKDRNGELGDLAKIDGQITLMMNWEDENYPELEKAMRVLSKAVMRLEGQKGDHIVDIHAEYITVCQKILKREWNRLKEDLKKKRV